MAQNVAENDVIESYWQGKDALLSRIAAFAPPGAEEEQMGVTIYGFIQEGANPKKEVLFSFSRSESWEGYVRGVRSLLDAKFPEEPRCGLAGQVLEVRFSRTGKFGAQDMFPASTGFRLGLYHSNPMAATEGAPRKSSLPEPGSMSEGATVIAPLMTLNQEFSRQLARAYEERGKDLVRQQEMLERRENQLLNDRRSFSAEVSAFITWRQETEEEMMERERKEVEEDEDEETTAGEATDYKGLFTAFKETILDPALESPAGQAIQASVWKLATEEVE